jgi:asparagine synthase (glutamine-hydrolysing)
MRLGASPSRDHRSLRHGRAANDRGANAIVFNGEIYNFRELRFELEQAGARMRTGSDTEVLLELYRRHGRGMVERLRGMFAFAIWDVERGGVLLGRDPYGIKPLYTANDGWTLRFASQVKALLAGGAVSTDPEPAGIVGFHLFGSVPEPFTLYREVRAVPAGHTQWIDAAGAAEPLRYHTIAGVLASKRPSRGPAETMARVRAACLDSARAHLVGDVEVGLFLSAGVDSCALLGLIADIDKRPVKAITLGFSEFEGTHDDETAIASSVARHYGAAHIVRRVGAAEFLDEIPLILEAMDQPSIDGVNTWFVAKAAREAGLKVALSGLGGDELLAGYPSFRDIPRWVARLRLLASVPGLGRGLRATGMKLGLLGRRPKALGLVEYGGSFAGAYLLRRGLFLPFELEAMLDPALVEDGLRRLDPVARIAAALRPDPGSDNARVTTLESTHYLRDQLLRDADWAGMAHGIEIRAPFVDATLLASLAPVIPGLAPGEGKRALARAPTRPLPNAVIDRAKTGFGVPIGQWLDPSIAPPAARRRPAGLVSRDWARRVFRAANPPLLGAVASPS